MYKPLKYCCTEKIKPIYNNIKEYNFFEPIKKYSKEYNIDFKINETKTKKLEQNDINDHVMNFYVKSTTNISFVFLYPQALKHKNILKKVMKLLEENGSVYYEKDIEFNYQMAYNLVYQLYLNEYRMKTPNSINFKVNHIGFDYDENKTPELIIKILIYKHKIKMNP